MLLDAWRLGGMARPLLAASALHRPSHRAPVGDPPAHPALIDDGVNRLQGRGTRLLSRRAHREYPSSRTRHMVSNVLITESSANELSVSAAFVVYRVRNRKVTQYTGRYLYVLERATGELKIRQNALNWIGKVSGIRVR